MAHQSKRTTLGEIGEHAAIRVIREECPSRNNGDDAAVLNQPAPNTRPVVATDMLVEGRHFRFEWSSPEQVGIKAITQNFADIEAMGARPTAALLALSTSKDTDVEVVRGIARGIQTALEPFSAQLIGGDITGGEKMVLAVTALGQLGGNRKELRLDAARPGQKVVANGRIGWSAAGLALLQNYEEIPEDLRPLVEHHCAPRIETNRGVIARATGATAMTDNSDGLIQDLRLIAERSGVGIDLKSHAIFPDELLCRAGKLTGIDPWEFVLSGGEDHTFLATTSKETPTGFREIGAVNKNTGLVTVDGLPPRHESGWVSF